MNNIRCKNKICFLKIKRRNGDIIKSTFSKKDLKNIKDKKWIVFKTHRQIYIRATKKYGGKFLHNVIINTDKNKKEFIDHINGNTLDNTRINLRIVNRYQNGWNMKIRKDNTTGIKGVIWYKKTNTWNSRISYKGKRIFLGYFKDKKDAINARKNAEKKLYGKYLRNLSK